MNLRIATWNICFGNNLDIVLQTISQHEAFQQIDILALQEASIHNAIDDARVVAQTLGKQYTYFQHTAQTTRGLIQANALIWNTQRINVLATDVVPLPTYKESVIGTMERTLKRVIKKEKRNAVSLTGKLNNKTIRIYSAHLDVVGFNLKTAQLEHVCKDNLYKPQVDFCCIAGDMNTFKIIKRPRWRSLQHIADTHQFTDITTDIKWTFRHTHLRYRQKTDAVFLQKDSYRAYNSQSLPLPGSDHIPIFANITL